MSNAHKPTQNEQSAGGFRVNGVHVVRRLQSVSTRFIPETTESHAMAETPPHASVHYHYNLQTWRTDGSSSLLMTTRSLWGAHTPPPPARGGLTQRLEIWAGGAGLPLRRVHSTPASGIVTAQD